MLRTDTFTYSEILDQPRAWRETLRELPALWEHAGSVADLRGADVVVSVGCGSSYYLSLVTAYALRVVAGSLAEAQPASELLLHEPAVFLPGRRYLVLGISRSGETTETTLALGQVRERKLGGTVAITCTPDSSIARAADARIVLPEAQERSVVMTKSFNTMLVALQYWISQAAGASAMRAELARLPDALDSTLERFAGAMAELGGAPGLSSYVFLGGGACYGIACEAALKVKEMAGLASVAFHPLEFRHGPISVVAPGTLVTWFVSDEAEAREAELLPELKRLGARILVLAEHERECIRRHADVAVALGSGLSSLVRLPLYLALAQLLAHASTVSRGLDPDRPRNLTQVVRLDG